MARLTLRPAKSTLRRSTVSAEGSCNGFIRTRWTRHLSAGELRDSPNAVSWAKHDPVTSSVSKKATSIICCCSSFLTPLIRREEGEPSNASASYRTESAMRLHFSTNSLGPSCSRSWPSQQPKSPMPQRQRRRSHPLLQCYYPVWVPMRLKFLSAP